jgi:hypothetical protein
MSLSAGSEQQSAEVEEVFHPDIIEVFKEVLRAIE